MQFQTMYCQQDRKQINELIHSQPYCYLVTMAKETQHVGMFNHIFDGQNFLLHLNVNDEQIRDMKNSKKALIVLHKFYSLIPSHWVDGHDGSAATAYYKYVEFECGVEILAEEDKSRILQEMMDHYQPEGGYDPLDPQSELYRKSFAAITLVRLRPINMRGKWKFGQNRPPEIRNGIVKALRARGHGLDLETATEVLRTLPARTDEHHAASDYY